ncbi:hypothetical protein SHELI_v1c03690 [Spiroplasma helicoides]|uniref:Uncharacterized protein n=1 Tax=Spiroplasma helicoides TaxID=216938 RepID=A0A1B3SK62_9MOLU|nr:hypothetical protein [Spiroplasma helicoides]AOG60322.1 hypothetical protein SHELI_v1c03690 [Spiroplasma helicoides]
MDAWGDIVISFIATLVGAVVSSVVTIWATLKIEDVRNRDYKKLLLDWVESDDIHFYEKNFYLYEFFIYFRTILSEYETSDWRFLFKTFKKLLRIQQFLFKNKKTITLEGKKFGGKKVYIYFQLSNKNTQKSNKILDKVSSFDVKFFYSMQKTSTSSIVPIPGDFYLNHKFPIYRYNLEKNKLNYVVDKSDILKVISLHIKNCATEIRKEIISHLKDIS